MNINISFFSLFMGILFSSFFILIVHLLRNNRGFLKGFGIFSVLMLYVFCICRMGVPIELHFSVPIRMSKFYNDLYEFLMEGHWNAFGMELSVLDTVKCVWFAVAFLLMACLLAMHCRNLFHYSRFRNNRHLRGEEILKTVQAEAKRYYKISLVIYPTADVPKTAGLFKKMILLPAGKHTAEELYYTLTHEYTHFLNRDLLVKMLVNVFVCVFWWNPVVYLLRLDLDQMLEMKCDMTVIQKFSDLQTQTYMAVLMRLYDDTEVPKGFFRRIASFFSMSFVRRGKRRKNLDRAPLVERFDMMANPPKKPKVLYTQVGFYFVCAAVMIASYLFILQPFFEPPEEEIYTNNSISAGSVFNGYILKRSNGVYYIVTENTDPYPIDEDTVKAFISCGYLLKEE